MDKVVIVTVTYNSSDFLARLIRAISLQTAPVEKVVVVDNASSEEHAIKNMQLAQKYSFVEIVLSPENLGGAGGFEKGIRYILDQSYEFDWVWIMDDDAFPRADCLEALLKYKDLNNAGALCPIIYGIELEKFQLAHHKNLSRFLDKDFPVVNSINEMHEVTEIQSNAFVGPLVKKDVVMDVGVPDGKLFIYGDDTEYMYRISRKYKVYLIKEAMINHRDVIEKQGTINPKGFWKEYYRFRNRMLFINKYGTSIINRLIGQLLVIKEILHYVGATLCKKKYRGIKRVRINCLLSALWDGLCGKCGKTLDPNDYYEKIDKINM